LSTAILDPRHQQRVHSLEHIVRGILIDKCTDVGRLENVHIHNVYWRRANSPYTLKKEEVDALKNYTQEHLEGFIIGELIGNTFPTAL